MREILKYSLFLFLSVLLISGPARAQNHLLCAAVYPCNPDGSVEAPFNQGECHDYYKKVCHAELVNKVSDELIICEEKRDHAVQANQELQVKIKKLRRKFRRSRKD